MRDVSNATYASTATVGGIATSQQCEEKLTDMIGVDILIMLHRCAVALISYASIAHAQLRHIYYTSFCAPRGCNAQRIFIARWAAISARAEAAICS